MVENKGDVWHSLACYHDVRMFVGVLVLINELRSYLTEYSDNELLGLHSHTGICYKAWIWCH